MGIDKGNDNAAVLEYDSIYGVHYPSISGQQGGGNAIHWDYQVQSTPSIVVILPNKLIAVKNVFPPEFENVADSVAQSGGIAMECITSVKNNRQRPEFSIFPNPAKNDVFIELGRNNPGSFSLQVFDLSGRKIFATKPAALGENKFIHGHLETLQAGMYILQVLKNSNPLHTQKLIIKR